MFCFCFNKGDRLIAVDGHCLLNRKYEETLRLMRATGEEVELVLSQAAHISSNDVMEGPTSTSEKGYVSLQRIFNPSIDKNAPRFFIALFLLLKGP